MSRPSVFGNVTPITETPSAEPSVTQQKPAQTDGDMMRTSLYLSRAVHDALREIAFHERVKLHDLFMEGIDTVLAKRRQPTSAEIKRKAS